VFSVTLPIANRLIGVDHMSVEDLKKLNKNKKMVKKLAKASSLLPIT
jgi:hypothetical protein